MRNVFLIALAAGLVAGCDDGGTVGPETGNEAGTITVDASEGWAYLAFDGGEAATVSVAEPTTSAGWDMAFNATRVKLNGGAAGPGGVLGYCLCQNEGLPDVTVMAMTPATELEDFAAVTSAELPQGASWVEEQYDGAIEDWYAYNPTTHVVTAAPQNVYAVRTASGDAFAKVHVIGLEGATQAHAGSVTVEYAYQAAAGEAFAAPDTVVLDASTGERLDLATGTVSTNGAWDLEIEGWTIRVNGGVSGTGSAGAYLTGETFDAITDAGAAPSGAFSTDSYAGVFGEHAWYRYNLDGNHQIWPTYEVYLIDTGAGVYKVQLIGYYSAAGDSRHITVRYELLD